MTRSLVGTVRPMVDADLPMVRTIEKAAYGSDAWSRRKLEDELINGFSDYLVIEVTDKGVVGFAGVWFMRDQLHLVTIAVDPLYQRCGFATQLLLSCFDLARQADMSSIVLEVRESNTNAQTLYERFGFRRLGRLRGYYRDDGEDAVVMQTPALVDHDQQILIVELARHYRN